MDLELTCWSDPRWVPKTGMEIIEIGALMVYVPTYEVVEEYQTFVKPTYEPTISDYCTKLTGISQDDIEDAFPIDVAASLMRLNFLPYLKDYTFCCYGKDLPHLVMEYNRAIPTSYVRGDWDPRYVNLKVFKECYKKSLFAAMRDLGIEVPEKQNHRALDDCYQTLKLIKQLKVKPTDALVNKNKSYNQKLEETKKRITDKFYRKVVGEANWFSGTEKLLEYCDWDYQKARNVFELFEYRMVK